MPPAVGSSDLDKVDRPDALKLLSKIPKPLLHLTLTCQGFSSSAEPGDAAE
jgi:hypothetical protein